jgi:uncharacterized protein (TIGR00251 family)
MSHPAVRQADTGVTIDVWVVPNSSRVGVAGLHGDKIRIRVSAPPEAGKANRAVADVLGDALGMPVAIVRGMSSRHKVFKVTGLDPEQICRKLGI